MTAGKRSELESFWRAHLDGWRRSDLNQREYCELHGLPLKRFGNWRAKLKHEESASASKLLYRRGDGLKHMSKHMTKEIVPPPSGYIPSARSTPPGGRQRFSEADMLGWPCESCGLRETRMYPPVPRRRRQKKHGQAMMRYDCRISNSNTLPEGVGHGMPRHSACFTLSRNRM